MQSTITRRFVLFFALLALFLLLPISLFLYGFLSTRVMAAVFIVICVGGVWILRMIITGANKAMNSELVVVTHRTTLTGARRLVWILRVLTVLSLGVLGYGLWMSLRAPVLPRVFGILFGSIVWVGFFIALKRLKRRSGG